MTSVVCAALLAIAQVQETITFLTPSDLIEARNVRLEAQLPHPGLQLVGKDADRPKLWYAPVAAEEISEGARVWFQRVNTGEAELRDQRVLCLSEIRDGALCPVALDPVAPAWSGVNNVCMRRSPHKPTWGGFNVFQILHTDTGYRMLYWDQPDETGQAGAMLAESKDGKEWVKESGAVFTEHNDAFTLLPYGKEYLLYQTALEDWPDKPYPDNLDKKRRVITLRRSADLRTWTPQQILLRPDIEDSPETEFYLMKAFRYGRGYAGLLMKYYGDPKAPGRHSAILKHELIVSTDAVHWERPFRATDTGFWSYADPVLLGNEIHFITWHDGGMRTAAYSPRRLTGVVARAEAGEFTTRPFPWPATGHILLDADAHDGWIEAELLDDSGARITSARVVRLESVEGTQIGLDIREGESHSDRTVLRKIRFRLQHATVFGIVF